MRRENGFSLMELLIVVAVILVLIALAVPNLMRARMLANETSAVQGLRQIATAEMSYHTTYSAVGFAPDLASLGGPAGGCSPSPATACVLDTVVSSGSKSGYQLFAAGFAPAGAESNTEFVASAAPSAFNRTGTRRFCIATSEGSVRVQIAPGTLAKDVPTCLAYPLM
jgi:type IV pilus assembly protein PilA